MNIEKTEQQPLHICQERLLVFVRAMISGNREREDDEHPSPHGPWDPVIRVALEGTKVAGPSPEPWKLTESALSQWVWRADTGALGKLILESIARRHPEIFDVIGGGGGRGSEVELNPQPLPPRIAFMISVARTVINRAELIQEIGESIRREGEQQGIIIVGGYISRFAEEFCGNGFRLKYPFPGPRPNWFATELDGIDLLVIATELDQAAKETHSQDLRHKLADASTKFAKTGVSRMQ